MSELPPKLHPPTPLRGFQRRFLRAQAHALRPVVQVGRAGITDGVVEAAGQALLDHELIKVRLDEPEEKKEMATDLASRTGSHLCGLVGHTVILYRAHPEKPKLAVPTRSRPKK
ncbi:MAG: YhbY family RNA-binding protein [Deltaproteobacteria bacterium]|nr:YhbY family RNA-binding protein [Deltaproteobacteria bacterium]